jgi:hypothetical protein
MDLVNCPLHYKQNLRQLLYGFPFDQQTKALFSVTALGAGTLDRAGREGD